VRTLAFLLLLFLHLETANAATMYVRTKDFAWQYGDPPGGFADFKNGGYKVREWLEKQGAPKLRDATRALENEVKRYFELEKDTTVLFAVMGPPRSTGGHDAYAYVWVEWVTNSKFFFDLDDKRHERKAGLARIAFEGGGERKIDIRDWYWERDLKDKPLDKVAPWDAAVLTRKMIDLHAFRPREKAELPIGDGKDAPY
jgi:hypothetical protein